MNLRPCLLRVRADSRRPRLDLLQGQRLVSTTSGSYPRRPQPHGWAFRIVIAVLVAIAFAIAIYLKVS